MENIFFANIWNYRTYIPLSKKNNNKTSVSRFIINLNYPSFFPNFPKTFLVEILKMPPGNDFTKSNYDQYMP